MGNYECIEGLKDLVRKEEAGADLASWSKQARHFRDAAYGPYSSVSIWEGFLNFYLSDYDIRLKDKEYQQHQIAGVKEFIREYGGSI